VTEDTITVTLTRSQVRGIRLAMVFGTPDPVPDDLKAVLDILVFPEAPKQEPIPDWDGMPHR